MKKLSVGIMAFAFVLGAGALAALFLLGRVVVELAREKAEALRGWGRTKPCN